MHLQLNLDTKFVPEFDDVFRSDGIDVRPVGPVAPNMNAIAERWVQSVQQECLYHFTVFGMEHLRHLIAEYLDRYHPERPHQGVGNCLLTGPPCELGDRPDAGEVVCAERLGGLLKHYRRAA